MFQRIERDDALLDLAHKSVGCLLLALLGHGLRWPRRGHAEKRIWGHERRSDVDGSSPPQLAL